MSQEYSSPRITRPAGLVVLGYYRSAVRITRPAGRLGYEVPHCPLLTSLPVAGGIGKPNKLSFAHKQQIYGTFYTKMGLVDFIL